MEPELVLQWVYCDNILKKKRNLYLLAGQETKSSETSFEIRVLAGERLRTTKLDSRQ